ncbi:DeoR/GlpR family DNA-binding transcription regulator [Salisaeta longa]|uniref:DeoR/GlpR family DNA-binding transcription regulator n=1 Tax=Salisaeta longa TaxID=503170 RepID=UPI0003B68CA3|nr:DeoR/GlpR family DNA-binding transcription regulator [Salisaeta longa]
MSEHAHSPAERHDFILKRLKNEGYVKVAALSEALHVSKVTIRKDLRELEDQNLLHRTYGGANLRAPYVGERPLGEKATEFADEKARIGETAAALVSARDSIIIGSGTTTLQVARHLPETNELTVITNAMNVARLIAQRKGIEILMLGGIVRHNAESTVGRHAEEMLTGYTCDTMFMGVDGFDVEYGLTTTNALEASLNQAMMHTAQRTVVVTDASKFGRRGFRRICGLNHIHRVITDDAVEPRVVDALEGQGITVDVV